LKDLADIVHTIDWKTFPAKKIAGGRIFDKVRNKAASFMGKKNNGNVQKNQGYMNRRPK
jgi:hypothetical protein